MDEIVHAIASGLRLSFFLGCTAGIFIAVVASVCRFLKWAPVNLTVNVNMYKEAENSQEGANE